MGLFVVSRLAKRHGLTVRLRPTFDTARNPGVTVEHAHPECADRVAGCLAGHRTAAEDSRGAGPHRHSGTRGPGTAHGQRTAEAGNPQRTADPHPVHAPGRARHLRAR